MARLLAILALAALQSCTQKRDRPGPAPVPSPYQIAEAFSSVDAPDVDALMKRLGLPVQLDKTSEFRSLECAKWTCRAEVTGAGPVAVRISSGVGYRIIWMEQERRDDAWSVRGYLGGYSKYGVRVRFVSKYLFVETTAVSGSPYWSIVQELYEPHDGRLVPVLKLPAYGQESIGPRQPHRKWNVTFDDTLASSNDPEELLAYARLVITTFDSDPPIFADERRVAVFVRPKGARAFQLDPKQSDITQGDLDELFHSSDDPVDATLFLSFARESLLRLARFGTPKLRDWLHAYLAQAPASSIKSQLLTALPPSNPQRPAKPAMVK